MQSLSEHVAAMQTRPDQAAMQPRPPQQPQHQHQHQHQHHHSQQRSQAPPAPVQVSKEQLSLLMMSEVHRLMVAHAPSGICVAFLS